MQNTYPTPPAVHARLVALAQSTNPYFSKDLVKAVKATKFIGRGSLASSTNRYMLAAGDLANCGEYQATDRVFVSVEGNRRNRIPLDLAEVNLAIEAGATIVADAVTSRNRPYNVGERELACHLVSAGYIENAPGVWTPSI